MNRKKIVSTLVLICSLSVPTLYNSCGNVADIESGGGASLNGDFSGSATGQIIDISPSGRVVGFTMDANNSGVKLYAHLYVDGPAGSGLYLGRVPANQSGGGSANGHYFTYDLPLAYADGAGRTFYAYGGTAESGNLLSGRGFSFTAYAPTPEGRGYYQQNVAGAVTCNGCHTWTYEVLRDVLLAPPPHLGGTRTSNNLIRKISGGTGHSGGNICGNVNGSPCDRLQQWFDAEFN